MATVAVIQKVDGERLEELQQTLASLDGTQSELVLDFSEVRRISPAALRMFEKLAAKAEEKSVRVVLRGVAVHVYKVLKLARLSERFGFVS
jgi:anti-anti-sigma regulatory factor